MTFPSDTTVGSQRLINVRIEEPSVGELYVPVRALLTVDQGAAEKDRPRFEWDINALGMQGMRIGADSIEDLCRSATYMVSVHLCQARAVILPGKDGYVVQVFREGSIDVGPGTEARPEDEPDA